MATRETRFRTAQDTAADNTRSYQGPQSPFDERDHSLARQLRPRLYTQITQDRVSFDHIAQAWWIGNNPARQPGKEEQRVSQFLEYLARRKFSDEHGGIEKDYWSRKPWAGCALTGDGCVHSVMNVTDPELVLYEDRVHKLCRDAHRTFEAAGSGEKAKRDLTEVGEMLYCVLTRVIVTASVLEDEHAAQHEKDEALAAVRIQWKTARASVEEMIQRQARFEYFQGVGFGALITIPALAVAGWAAVHYGPNQLSEPGEPGSFTAAIIGGAAGAVISVTQRMMSNTTLELDFTAPKMQKWALGALRPVVGAVFGAVVYFAIIGGLLAVNARTGKDASIALAFFAVAGFAAGFSERFATDVLQRASSGIVPATQGKRGVEKQDELSQLLAEQPRHAGTRTVSREPQPAAPQPPASGQAGTRVTASDPRKQPPRHHLLHRSAK